MLIFNSHTGILDEYVEIHYVHQLDEKEDIVLDAKDSIDKNGGNVTRVNSDKCRKDMVKT